MDRFGQEWQGVAHPFMKQTGNGRVWRGAAGCGKESYGRAWFGQEGQG